ncbi:MAG TPA: cell division protein FtsQ/DivIB, partial [Stellaceae bacterium]|nr:cell division protein FtsQ/DivIB [Stellaceae bacterium]
HAADLIAVLATQPDLQRHVQSAVLVGGRRWDVHFDDGIVAELPETDVAAAWAKLAGIERSHAILERDVTKVDLRVPDRIGVYPAAEPARPATPAAPKPQAKPGAKPT